VDVIELIGRVLFAVVFVVSPALALRQLSMLVGAPPLRWMPPALRKPVVGATSVVAIAGAVLIALGLWPDLGALLVLAFLVAVTPVMHRFWEVEDPGQRAIRRGSFLINVSLAGAALLVFALYHETQHVAAGLVGEPLF
jgi:uncharacterized membrane protein YphA (DoxX/SURF4 family)